MEQIYIVLSHGSRLIAGLCGDNHTNSYINFTWRLFSFVYSTVPPPPKKKSIKKSMLAPNIHEASMFDRYKAPFVFACSRRRPNGMEEYPVCHHWTHSLMLRVLHAYITRKPRYTTRIRVYHAYTTRIPRIYHAYTTCKPRVLHA